MLSIQFGKRFYSDKLKRIHHGAVRRSLDLDDETFGWDTVVTEVEEAVPETVISRGSVSQRDSQTFFGNRPVPEASEYVTASGGMSGGSSDDDDEGTIPLKFTAGLSPRHSKEMRSSESVDDEYIEVGRINILDQEPIHTIRTTNDTRIVRLTSYRDSNDDTKEDDSDAEC